MGLSRKKMTTMKVGEFQRQAGETWYGGSPAGINKSGKLVLAHYGTLVASKTDSTAISYVGIFVNPSLVDADTYKGQSTFYAGTCIVTMTKLNQNTDGSVTNVDGTAFLKGDGYPYDSSLTFDESNLLYVDINGLWTNVQPSSGKPCFGTVIEVGTSSITALMYNVPSAVY